MEQVIVAIVAVHMLVGALICGAFASAEGFKLRPWVCFVAALAASMIAGIATALLFSVSGLERLPGGFMEGGLITLLLMVVVFTFVWAIAAALISRRIARWFTARSA